MKDKIYKWDERHAKILMCFVRKMNEHNINYLILRNHEGLPTSNQSKDVDIAIRPGTYSKAKDILLESYRENGISYYHIADFWPAHCIYGIDLESETFIHLDLIEGYTNKGFCIMPFDDMMSHTKDYHGLNVLSDSYNVVMLILYKLIGFKKHVIKDSYIEHIYNLYPSVKSEVDNTLKLVLGVNTSGMIINSLENHNFTVILDNVNRINDSAKLRALKRQPFQTIKGLFLFYAEKVGKLIICFNRLQKLICVEAPDGTGKTTFIDNLKVKIAEAYVADISKSNICHFRPSILPNLGAAGEKVGVMKEDKNFENPHRKKPANFFSSLVRMTYYWIDYVLGVPMKVRMDVQFDKFTIFDRYIYDFLVDPRRTRISLPYWTRSLFIKLVKQPKLVFVLNTTADIIYQRKQELSKEEIERQLVEYRKLVNVTSNVVLLDASNTPEEIAKDAMRHIADTFMKKI